MDTRGLLVDPAAKEACEAMIQAGLNAKSQEAFLQRQSMFEANPRADVYESLVNHFGIKPGSSVSEGDLATVGRKAFYHREVEPHIELFPPVRNLLRRLRSRGFKLFLVSAGSPDTQRQKIEILNISDEFDDIFLVDSARGESKFEVIQGILGLGFQAHTVLVVGDRIDREIAAGNRLGTWTCRLSHGEYSHLVPTHVHEVAHFTIDEISALDSLLESSVVGCEIGNPLASSSQDD
ncbi:MAG: HAD hydrolase-like protein [Acidobacteria bacterium]|nr:HAD hydrolase-like protein [Acidobacteriota bacterium]